MIWFRQNRVALTILIGLALIALVAIGQSAVAFFAIALRRQLQRDVLLMGIVFLQAMNGVLVRM